MFYKTSVNKGLKRVLGLLFIGFCFWYHFLKQTQEVEEFSELGYPVLLPKTNFKLRHFRTQKNESEEIMFNQQFPRNQIHVVYQFYIDDDKRRQIELDLALEKNILNNEIDCIHLLLEKKGHIPCYLLSKYDKCIYVWLLGKRLTFNNAIEFSQNRLRGLFVAVINSDVYFDKTIRLLKQIAEMKNKLIALSVIEADNNGRTRDLRCSKQYIGSHDTYIFKPPVNNFQEVYDATDVYVGGITGWVDEKTNTYL
ncbi:unnamed protein product [Didymodactylos carnosus]|uniref:Uncharacterized protein n=1 Tax=Didymodactylos carnosus TaxID=1234261 RepID=A0A815A7L3_9BILA|nr:unnamed protein product [Didymodactylos carnosus]CAF4027803.1 unnamed protein product [Didymodactylos carnosus]